MAIKRAPRLAENFYILDKKISEDCSISWAARGLLIFLLGKPDNWEVSVQHLINQTADARIKSGRDAVRALLRELMDAGYIQKTAAHDVDGRFSGYDYMIGESKFRANPPETPNPATDDPATANPPLIRTEVLTRTEEQQSITKVMKLDYSALFDMFWKAYPRKVAKDAARKAFDKRKPTQELLDEMLKAISYQMTDDQWKKDDGRFIPHPSTWLNEGRWMDEHGSSQPANSFPGML